MSRFFKQCVCAVSLLVAGVFTPALAQVTSVKDPWVRATVARQKSTSAYMEITAGRAGRLLEAVSPVAGTVEIHEMRMEKDMMRMRAIASLDLPAGRPVTLEPGGFHIMLMDLKVQIKEGDKVPITLIIEQRSGARETVEISASVRPIQASSSGHGAGHGKSSHSH